MEWILGNLDCNWHLTDILRLGTVWVMHPDAYRGNADGSTASEVPIHSGVGYRRDPVGRSSCCEELVLAFHWSHKSRRRCMLSALIRLRNRKRTEKSLHAPGFSQVEQTQRSALADILQRTSQSVWPSTLHQARFSDKRYSNTCST